MLLLKYGDNMKKILISLYILFCITGCNKVEEKNPFKRNITGNTLEEKSYNNLSDKNVLSQKGLVEMFEKDDRV